MKVLFLVREFESLNTGKAVVSHRNLRLLEDTFGKKNVSKIILPPVVSRRKILFGELAMYMGGLSKEIEKEIIERISSEKIDILTIDGSIYGKIIKSIKQLKLNCRVIVFYHNIEYLYFKFLMKRTCKVWHYLTIYAAFKNEQMIAKYADDLVVLNKRDSVELYNIYGREASICLPVSYDDRFDMRRQGVIEEPTALFIGSLFFPNYSGIKWFIDKVMPNLKCKLLIVGTGFEKVRSELESNNIRVIGTADNIDDYYYNSSFVVAPIFEGSGMKTKTAEALMFGKTVFGTNEALEGYKEEKKDALVACNTKEEFVSRINNFVLGNNAAFNPQSRELFTNNYCYEAVLDSFKKYIQTI